MIHLCSPSRWRGPQGAGGTHHATVVAGTTVAFAMGQLHAGMLTAFQQLLRENAGIATAIEAENRFPPWEAVGNASDDAARLLQHILQCRRLADLLAGNEPNGARAVLTFVGWQRLSNDANWRTALPQHALRSGHPDSESILRGWVNALLVPDTPAGEEDSRQHLHEMAACAFRPLGVYGALTATLAEQRLDRIGAPSTQLLADALAGDPPSRDALRALAADPPVGDAHLDALLVAALNPPLCLPLLVAEDPISSWDCLQPGRRFRRLFMACADLPALDGDSSPSALEAWIDFACDQLSWPRHSIGFERAQRARDEVDSMPELAATARWLSDNRQRSDTVPTRPPPATAACTQYVAFLDVFIASRGGYLRSATPPPIVECRPLEPIDDERTPTPRLAALVQAAAASILEDLIDGVALAEAGRRVLDVLTVAGWPRAAENVAVTLRLPSLASHLPTARAT